MERGSDADKHRPVFLWADESQFFASPQDLNFQSTARSSKICTVYLTQSLSTYDTLLGSRERVLSIIGNLNTKIFHANGDTETNTFAADLIARSWQDRSSSNMGSNSQDQSNKSFGTSQSFDYDVTPQEFTTMKCGGSDSNYTVEAILSQSGRVWSNGKSYQKLTFSQRS